MSRYVFKMPDLGEGTVSAEVVAWHVRPGDLVEEDQPMCEVMTEKAAVEVPAPVTGRIVSLNGQPGDMVAVGAELVVFETDAGAGSSNAKADASASETAAASGVERTTAPRAVAHGNGAGSPGTNAARVMASPATRRRAQEAGIDLTTVVGTGPGGRIEKADLDAVLQPRGSRPATNERLPRATGADEIKLIGLRRVIAERMAEVNRSVPHFSYVEEVDVTQLEALRVHLNGKLADGAPQLTFLPFVAAALTRVLADFPQCNAHFDSGRSVIVRHHAVHLGIATQTPQGLKVPVVRHAETLGLQALANEIRRVAADARANKSPRDELTGSTITLTSLGRLGGIVSTPVINLPEVAIVGINKAVERPMVVDGAVAVRLMMNLSSSFDHRFVDGYDAAAMIQALKERLEHPATIFIDA
ncbi:MAG TPA: dihydrolipoamide acetyltransferase family protein [Steroidobacteraceae bacterium]|nr:dihydrolipoamide acetyltransferase family protein [Steroidobacteraceae bacterium]